MGRTVVDSIYDENQAVINHLINCNEISLASDMDNKLKKLLLLSAASYFESEIQDAIRDFVSRASNMNGALIGLAGQAIERKYHTYFDWDGTSANKFFAMFGEEFSKLCKQAMASQDGLRASAKAFLELGRTRNELAHLNFASFPIDKTAIEIYGLYQSAYLFLDFLRVRLGCA